MHEYCEYESYSGVHPSTEFLEQQPIQVADFYSFLLHAIPIAEGDRILQIGPLLTQCFEIYSYAEGRARLVLTPVSAANRARLVVKNCHVWSQQIAHLPGFAD